MNIYLKNLIILLSLTMVLSSFAAESYEELAVNPKIDDSFIINLETIDSDDVIVDPKAWYHLTEDDIGYLRIQYSIINNTDETMFGHKWAVKIEGEEFSEDVIALLQPGQLKTFSHLVFGGVIQNTQNSLSAINLSIITYKNSIFQLGKNSNSMNCPPYVDRCKDPSMIAAVSRMTPLCLGRCLNKGGGGVAICVAGTYELNGKQCTTSTIVCSCDNGNNPESALGLPEIGRERSLDPYIRNMFQEQSSLHSRPFDIIE